MHTVPRAPYDMTLCHYQIHVRSKRQQHHRMNNAMDMDWGGSCDFVKVLFFIYEAKKPFFKKRSPGHIYNFSSAYSSIIIGVREYNAYKNHIGSRHNLIWSSLF